MTDLLDGRGKDYVHCWTIQHRRVWETLQRTGRYRVRKRYIEPDFIQAYDWLGRQTRQRITGATGRYPVWAYARISRTDLRKFARHGAQYGNDVLLVCRVPARQVILTDYGAWHDVLNNAIMIPDDDPDAHDRWWDSLEARLSPEQVTAGLGMGGVWPPEIQAEVEASWQHLFNVEQWIKHYPGSVIQATFEELRLEYVVRMVSLTRSGVAANRRIGNLVRYL